MSALWLPQVIQLLACDLLLSLRTSLWQKQASSSQALGETYHASPSELTGFQRDLGSLRKLAHSFRPAYRKVSFGPCSWQRSGEEKSGAPPVSALLFSALFLAVRPSPFPGYSVTCQKQFVLLFFFFFSQLFLSFLPLALTCKLQAGGCGLCLLSGCQHCAADTAEGCLQPTPNHPPCCPSRSFFTKLPCA